MRIGKLVFIYLFGYTYAAEWTHAKQGDWPTIASTCGTGKQQSPINLVSTASIDEDLAITLNPTYKNYFKDRTILKESYTVKEAFTDGGMTLTFADGSKSAFVPAQFHVHAPSEHTFDGVYRDLEIHFVHTYVGGALGAVIGVTFDRVAGGNNENLFLDQFLPVYAQNEETVL